MGGRTNILVVDDEPLVRELIVETLSFGAYTVRAVDGAQEAFAACAADPPDVVLLDIGLAGDLDGFAVCRRLRERPDPPAIVFLSGLGGDEQVAAGIDAGASAYLTKPFSPLELIETLRRAHQQGGAR